MRNTRRKLLFVSAFIFVNLYFLNLGFSDKGVTQVPFDYKSYNFNVEKECRLPRLKLKGHERHAAPVACRIEANWGTIVESKWALKPVAVQGIEDIECRYRAVTRKDDFELQYSSYKNITMGERLGDDITEVLCSGYNELLNKTVEQSMLFYQVIPKLVIQKEKIIDEYPGCQPLSVLMLSYDSVSQVSWILRLNKTIDYMVNKMGFQLMNGFNIIGDGTPAALMPVLLGKTEEELPSALKNDPKGKYVDEVFPFIFKELHKQEYVTMFNEDWPQVGTFQYRMRGAKEDLTTHYLRAFQMQLLKKLGGSFKDDLCIGDKKRHKYNIDILNEFFNVYEKDTKKFAFMHYNEYSHDGNEPLRLADDDIYEFLKTNHESGKFENTALILYSDHGDRFNSGRQSEQGYLEERLPFLSIYLPPKYRQENPQKYQNLMKNKNKLITPFDIHPTIRDLTCLNKNKNEIRAISLLENIPETRSCEDIGVLQQYCTCTKWFPLNTDDKLAIEGASFLVSFINNLIKDYNQCRKLHLTRIVSTEISKSKTIYLLKLKIVTLPNEGIYETQVEISHESMYLLFEKKLLRIHSPRQINRLNRYGSQASCVDSLNADIDLRKFCHCF